MRNLTVVSLALIAAPFDIGTVYAPNCNGTMEIEDRTIKSFLDNGGGKYVSLRYDIKRSVQPRYEGESEYGSAILLEYQSGNIDEYTNISFQGMQDLIEHVASGRRFKIGSMKMICGDGVTIIGDVSRQPLPMNYFPKLRPAPTENACVAALRRSGQLDLLYEETEGDKRHIKIRLRGLNSDMRKGERMVQDGLRSAQSGTCRLDPPRGPS